MRVAGGARAVTRAAGTLQKEADVEQRGRPRACDCAQVEWEEHWWEASDWAGMREMGAEKSGCRCAPLAALKAK
jgi:hypothetical protein